MPLALPTAALLAIGKDAVLSHRSAAAIWGLADPNPDTIDVTLAARNPAPTAGRPRCIASSGSTRDDITTRSNLAVTSLARTAIDFAASGDKFRVLLRRLPRRERSTGSRIARCTRRSIAYLATTAAPRSSARCSRSAATVRPLRQPSASCGSCAGRAELPQPLVNQMRNGFLVDFLWQDAEADRRSRRTRHARNEAGVRERPPAGPDPRRGRLPRDPRHLGTVAERTAGGDRRTRAGRSLAARRERYASGIPSRVNRVCTAPRSRRRTSP